MKHIRYYWVIPQDQPQEFKKFTSKAEALKHVASELKLCSEVRITTKVVYE